MVNPTHWEQWKITIPQTWDHGFALTSLHFCISNRGTTLLIEPTRWYLSKPVGSLSLVSLGKNPYRKSSRDATFEKSKLIHQLQSRVMKLSIVLTVSQENRKSSLGFHHPCNEHVALIKYTDTATVSWHRLSSLLLMDFGFELPSSQHLNLWGWRNKERQGNKSLNLSVS